MHSQKQLNLRDEPTSPELSGAAVSCISGGRSHLRPVYTSGPQHFGRDSRTAPFTPCFDFHLVTPSPDDRSLSGSPGFFCSRLVGGPALLSACEAGIILLLLRGAFRPLALQGKRLFGPSAAPAPFLSCHDWLGEHKNHQNTLFFSLKTQLPTNRTCPILAWGQWRRMGCAAEPGMWGLWGHVTRLSQDRHEAEGGQAAGQPRTACPAPGTHPGGRPGCCCWTGVSTCHLRAPAGQRDPHMRMGPVPGTGRAWQCP